MYLRLATYFLLGVGAFFIAGGVKNTFGSAIVSGVIMLTLSAADSQLKVGLKSIWNRINVRYIVRPRYIYDMLVRSKIYHPLNSAEVESMVNKYLESKNRVTLPNTLSGNNYYQFSLVSPPETIQIRWHESIEDLSELDCEDFEPTSYDLLVSLASPHIARINDLDDRRMDALVSLLSGLSSHITTKLGLDNSRILVTVNRLEGNEQPKALRPPGAGSAKREEINGAIVLRDDHSLQIFSRDPAAVMQSMTKDLDSLLPA